MPLMVWDDGLDVGVEQMNHEHKGLLELMNALYDAVQSGRSGPETLTLLGELERATKDHFAHEEAYMDRTGYAGAASHKQIHAQLLGKLEHHAANARAANGALDDTFFQFLRFWLSAHIRGIDMKYAPAGGLAKAG